MMDSQAQTWAPNQQLVIDWRMPQDITRVLIFERLEYLVEDKKQAATASDLYDQQQELIMQVKQFYLSKLETV